MGEFEEKEEDWLPKRNAKGEQLCMPVWCGPCRDERRRIRYAMVVCDLTLKEGSPDACAVELAKAKADEDGSESEDEDGGRAGVVCSNHTTSMVIELMEGSDGETNGECIGDVPEAMKAIAGSLGVTLGQQNISLAATLMELVTSIPVETALSCPRVQEQATDTIMAPGGQAD